MGRLIGKGADLFCYWTHGRPNGRGYHSKLGNRCHGIHEVYKQTAGRRSCQVDVPMSED
jgi:hypothetical protein